MYSHRVTKDIPERVAVYVAQVPLTYYVSALMRHPVCVPLVYAFRYPEPENTPVLAVVVVAALLDVVVDLERVVGTGVVLLETGEPDLGRYRTPELGQVDVVPANLVNHSQLAFRKRGRKSLCFA
jgi:hypothetical protein